MIRPLPFQPRSPHARTLTKSLSRFVVSFIVISLVVTIGASIPLADSYAAGDTTTALGCTITPLKPTFSLGVLTGRAEAACSTDMADRVITIQVFQKHDGDQWELVESTITEEDASIAMAFHQTGTIGVSCRELDHGRSRKFHTQVFVTNDAGESVYTQGDQVELRRDCIVDSWLPVENGTSSAQSANISVAAASGNGSGTYYLWSCVATPKPPVLASQAKLRAKSQFQCDPSEADRGLLSVLVENTPLPWDKAVRTAVYWDLVGNALTKDVTAKCTVKSNHHNTDYYTSAQEDNLEASWIPAGGSVDSTIIQKRC